MRKRNGNLFSVSPKFDFFTRHVILIKKNFKVGLVFHCFGISVLGAALFLQSSVLGDILKQGYFVGTEKNAFVLYSEVFLTAIAMSYLFYLLWKFIISKI